MLKLYFNESHMRAIINNEEVEGNCITLYNIGEYSLQLLPCTTRLILQPIYTTILIGVNGELITALNTIAINDKEFYILPNFLPYISATCPKIINQKDYGEHRVTVYFDTLIHACIENDTNYIDVILPSEPTQIITPSINNCALFIFCAERYISVIIYDYVDYYNILDKLCDGYEIMENGIIFRTEFNDNQGRVCYEEYTFENNGYRLVSENYEYKNSHKCTAETLPIDFTEAVLNKDYIYAYNLVQNVDITMDNIVNMFGSDGQIVNICSCCTDNYIAVLSNINDKQCYSRYKFVVERDKIIDIVEI